MVIASSGSRNVPTSVGKKERDEGDDTSRKEAVEH
jgi:hypothetical protein